SVIFHIKEKPTIRYINIKGYSYIEEEKIRENLTIATGAILNIFKVRSNIDQIETLYKEKNYHKARIDYKIKPLDNNQADLEFIIEEGPKIYVTAINFEGNKAFPEKDLKKMLKV
ncbi:MAG: outer membrane protein assembly factor BamA, partial [Desulfatitalea sp.]|nr:outer membrane protein assembly factor BamA [Desulfatitalea sp.]